MFIHFPFLVLNFFSPSFFLWSLSFIVFLEYWKKLDESATDVDVPQSFFSPEELQTLMDATKPEWVPAKDYFDPATESCGKIGRGGLLVEEPLTGTRLRRLTNGRCFGCFLDALQ